MTSIFKSAPTFATAVGTADALGSHTLTQTNTATGVGAGMAVGFAGSVAAAQNFNATPPQAATTAHAHTSGGDTTTGYTNHLSISFPAGSTQVTASISVGVAGAHGFDPLSATLNTQDHFSATNHLPSLGPI